MNFTLQLQRLKVTNYLEQTLEESFNASILHVIFFVLMEVDDLTMESRGSLNAVYLVDVYLFIVFPPYS